MEYLFCLFVVYLASTGFDLCQSANVAFTLGQTSNLYLSHGEQMSYDKAITNVAANFDSRGSFVCKKPGMYAFHFFSLSDAHSRTWIDLYRNINYVCSVFGYTTHGYADAGNSVMLHLDEGDTVSLRSHATSNTTFYGKIDQIYTTFTGVLLNPEMTGHQYEKETFSVGLDHNIRTANGDIVKYNNIITNTNGNAYSPLTGKFTASVDGTFIFHYHGLAPQDQAVWLELYNNDEYINSAFGKTVSGFADAGNTAILHLSSGDQVYVKTRANNQVELFGGDNQVYATFSGSLLAPIAHDFDDSRSEASFSVGLTHNFNGATLVFDRVYSNRGGGYSQATGHFTAKESGVYVFHYHAMSQTNTNVWVELFHNFHYIDSLFGGSSGEFATGSNAAVLNLVAGDTVFLRSKKTTHSYYGKYDQVYCTFSGYRLDNLEEIIIGNPGVIIG